MLTTYFASERTALQWNGHRPNVRRRDRNGLAHSAGSNPKHDRLYFDPKYLKSAGGPLTLYSFSTNSRAYVEYESEVKTVNSFWPPFWPKADFGIFLAFINPVAMGLECLLWVVESLS